MSSLVFINLICQNEKQLDASAKNDPQDFLPNTNPKQLSPSNYPKVHISPAKTYAMGISNGCKLTRTVMGQ
jgi:hypothetical protein